MSIVNNMNSRVTNGPHVKAQELSLFYMQQLVWNNDALVPTNFSYATVWLEFWMSIFNNMNSRVTNGPHVQAQEPSLFFMLQLVWNNDALVPTNFSYATVWLEFWMSIFNNMNSQVTNGPHVQAQEPSLFYMLQLVWNNDALVPTNFSYATVWLEFRMSILNNMNSRVKNGPHVQAQEP